MEEFDEKLQKHLKTATVFKGTSSAIQNDIIEPISAVILEKNKKGTQGVHVCGNSIR